MIINPQKLDGNWTEGFALDLHTISSTPKYEIIKEETPGIKKVTQIPEGTKILHFHFSKDEVPALKIIGWDTKRTEIGEQQIFMF